MLRKRERLTRSLFSGLLGAKAVHSPHFLLRWSVPSTLSSDHPRIGVSVSKKVAPSAVVRNRTRRRTYVAVRPLIPSLPAGLYLLSAKSGAPMLKGEALSEEIANLLKRR